MRERERKREIVFVRQLRWKENERERTRERTRDEGGKRYNRDVGRGGVLVVSVFGFFPTIRVRISLKPTVLSEKNENQQKEAGVVQFS